MKFNTDVNYKGNPEFSLDGSVINEIKIAEVIEMMCEEAEENDFHSLYQEFRAAVVDVENDPSDIDDEVEQLTRLMDLEKTENEEQLPFKVGYFMSDDVLMLLIVFKLRPLLQTSTQTGDKTTLGDCHQDTTLTRAISSYSSRTTTLPRRLMMRICLTSTHSRLTGTQRWRRTPGACSTTQLRQGSSDIGVSPDPG